MTQYAIITAIAVLLAAAPGARSSGPAGQSTAGALAIIVHRSNPVDNLTRPELRRIFMIETQTWSNGRKITVMLREKGQPERSEAIRLISGLSEEQYDRHILLQTFRGAINQGPREILSAAAMLRFVFNVPGAIGFVSAAEADDSTKVLRIDGMLPGDAQYPLSVRARPAARGED